MFSAILCGADICVKPIMWHHPNRDRPKSLLAFKILIARIPACGHAALAIFTPSLKNASPARPTTSVKNRPESRNFLRV
jgi:hypothetical protein